MAISDSPSQDGIRTSSFNCFVHTVDSVSDSDTETKWWLPEGRGVADEGNRRGRLRGTNLQL